MERVIRNLVLNAVEHGESKPIDITIGSNQNAVAITVRDYGIGMSEEACRHVFDRFWRADPARARTTGGSGLGLSISMEDTRLHDGRLEAWGKPGVGSVFRLTSPRSEEQEIVSSPLPLDPSVPESLASVVLGDSFPLTGEVPKIGYTPLILDLDLDEASPDDDVTDPSLGSGERKKEGES